jgi:hypothetical protein
MLLEAFLRIRGVQDCNKNLTVVNTQQQRLLCTTFGWITWAWRFGFGEAVNSPSNICIAPLPSTWPEIALHQVLIRLWFSEFRNCRCQYCIRDYISEKKLHGLSPRANYTDQEIAACRRSDCQLLRIEDATWPARRIPTAVFSVFRQEPLLFYQVAPQLYSRGWVDSVPDPLLFFPW